MSKFGADQLLQVERLILKAGEALSDIGFDVGVESDEQRWEDVLPREMSGMMLRLANVRVDLESAIDLLRAYELWRTGRA